MTDISKLPYRPCVGIALFNAEGRVFVGERIDTPGAWQMPQGGIDPGEDLSVAAARELYEEIGVMEDKFEILEIAQEKFRYDLPPYLQTKLWNGAFRGQEQTWIATRFLGTAGDINLNAHTPAEFQNWKWVTMPEMLDLIVPFKKETYQHVIRLFQKFSI